MPYKAKKPCRHFGCRFLTDNAYCANHKPAHDAKMQKRLEERRAKFDNNRPSFRERGYSSLWDRQARIYLHANPLCVHCDRMGLTVSSKEVDHMVPHKGDSGLFWSKDNWQALCKSCHSKKTRKEAHEIKTHSTP